MTTIYGTYSGSNGTMGSAGTAGSPTGGTAGNGSSGYSELSGSLTSYAQITGGRGGVGGTGYIGAVVTGIGGQGGNAGLGVYLATGAELTNNGTIAGGAGGSGGAYGGSSGNGAVGLSLVGASALNSSTGTISGGSGGNGTDGHGSTQVIGDYFAAMYGGTAGNGADGADLFSQSSLGIGGGQISGGNGGSGGSASAAAGGNGANGGIGVYLSGASQITSDNGGLITGGAGGNGGYSGSHVGNLDDVYAGSAGNGGIGVLLSSGSSINGVVSGQIIGGNGGTGGSVRYYDHGYVGFATGGGSGGTGIDLSSGELTVGGLSTGGNLGQITGGNGGNGGTGFVHNFFAGDIIGVGGNGGNGVNLSSATLVNGGDITGGNGGNGGHGFNSAYAFGGNGGAGVFASSATLVNTGTISGGHGGNCDSFVYGYSLYGDNGGAGVYLNGGSLTTSGTISGGLGGPIGSRGDAVQFGGAASTLVVKPGADFFGQVAAQSNDVLELSGREAGGTGIILGAQFTGFGTLDFASGAAWTVQVSAGTASASIDGFTVGDTIDVRNLTPTQIAAEFNSSSHVLTTGIDGTLSFEGAFGGSRYLLFSSDGASGTDITVVKGSGISTILTSTITLGGAAHPSPLTITSTGGVSPTSSGGVGVISALSGNSLINDGTLQGGAGTNGSVGGIGVKLSAGTVNNAARIIGGAGGAGTTVGGAGGAGVLLNGGTLINANTISGGPGGSGPTNGAAGDAVKFGTAAGTLVVDPGALFNGQVIANASAHDVLEVAGIQSSGTAITLGTQFTNFSTLNFAAGAAWTVDATRGDLTAHPLTIEGFTTSDALDITNLAAAGAKLSFDATNEILAITKGATTIDLGFTSAFTGEHFVFTANGIGGNLTLQANTPSADVSAHGFSSHVPIAQGLVHEASVWLR